jgi:hypothetical protein
MAIDAMHMLGSFYADQGRLTEAELMYQRALEGKGRWQISDKQPVQEAVDAIPKDHPDRASHSSL